MAKLLNSFDLIDENLKYYSGDTFFGWLGPRVPDSDPKASDIMGAIEKVFQSSNKIKEVVDRHRTSLVGKPPHWYFTDPEGDRLDNAPADAEKLLQRFIDHQNRLAISQENQLQNAIAEAVKNCLVTGVGYLRLWSPARFKDSPDSVMRVCLHSPTPSSVVLQRDSDGFTEAITYSYTEDNLQRKEVQLIDPQTNKTVFVTLDESGEIIPDSKIALELGGRYSIYELRSPSLITQSVKQAQNAINFALTMLLRGVEVAGFRERLILGAQPPGRWEDDKFIPDSQFSIGPGQTSFIQGVPTYDENNQQKGYTNPSVSYAEPVSPQSFIDTAMAFTAVIYDEFSQSHLLGSDLQLSGVSREQARQDFQTKLGEHADIVSAAIAGTYASALLMMVQDNVEQYKDLDVAVELRLNTSKPLPQEQEQLLKFNEAKLLSDTTAIALAGFTDDPDGEKAIILEEERDRTAVEDTMNLTTSGILDQPQAVDILKQRGRLKSDVAPGNTDPVLNGNGAAV